MECYGVTVHKIIELFLFSLFFVSECGECGFGSLLQQVVVFSCVGVRVRVINVPLI